MMYLCQKYCFSTDDYVATSPNHNAEFQLLFNKISVIILLTSIVMQKISWPVPANIDAITVHRREILQQECLEELINVIKKIINIDTDNDRKEW